MLLQRGRDGRFAARREAREPESVALLAAESAALGVRERRVPSYVPVRGAPHEGWFFSEFVRWGRRVMGGERQDLRCCHFCGRFEAGSWGFFWWAES